MLRHLPFLPDYTCASAAEARIKPIRGREIKPLGARRDWRYCSIRRESSNDIVARLYNTDVIRWCPDGSLRLNTGGYSTKLTTGFLHTLLRPYFRNTQGRIWLNDQPLHNTKPNHVEVVDGAYTVIDAPLVYNVQANRKRKAEALSPYRPFLAWLKGYCWTRRDVPVTHDEIRPSSEAAARSEVLALTASPDPEDWYRTLPVLLEREPPNFASTRRRWKSYFYAGHMDIFDAFPVSGIPSPRNQQYLPGARICASPYPPVAAEG